MQISGRRETQVERKVNAGNLTWVGQRTVRGPVWLMWKWAGEGAEQKRR